MAETPRPSRVMPAKKMKEEIIDGLISHNEILSSAMRLTRPEIKSRAVGVLGVMKESWRAGYEIHRPANIRLVHCEAALNSWRERGISRSTASIYWSALRYYLEAIGKAGMLPPLGRLWPVGPKEERTTVKKIVLSSLPEKDYQDLLGRLDVSQPTYWVIRLERELSLLREEALASNIVVGASRQAGTLAVSRAGGLRSRGIELRDTEQRRLVADVVDYLDLRERRRLCWPDKSIPEAVRKVTKALSYQLSKIKSETQGDKYE